MNCQISPDYDNLNYLNSIYKWIPNSDQVRPSDVLKDKKDSDYLNANNFYNSTLDYLYDLIFDFNTKFNSDDKLISENVNNLVKIFRPNDYPYQLNKGSNHYVMWYNCKDKPYDDDLINQDINMELNKIFNKYQYVWYENPAMSVPEIYHVQVFFIIN